MEGTVMTTTRYARLAGLLYLVPMFLGPFSMMYVPGLIIAPDDAATTASNLINHETLFRLGMLSDAVIFLVEIALTAVLYVALRPAGAALSLTAMLARIVMTVLQGVNLVLCMVALSAPASALLVLGIKAQSVHVWELAFGLHCLAVGVLVFRSGFAPKVFGALLSLAGVGYFLNGAGALALPQLATFLAAFVGIAAVVGEVPFVFWLVIRGVDEQRYGAGA
ncbi:MAG: DUF4386 domain-containing protein [Archangium gephyra]|uniref:DUF4386 domain-containing protein n=1 Tax=Archangium gephyra TaxID=48 RepID=A0A2W5SSW9_9BACT|nr:MAG: DUF4386 domain-containing protein [Archangium gephyra]